MLTAKNSMILLLWRTQNATRRKQAVLDGAKVLKPSSVCMVAKSATWVAAPLKGSSSSAACSSASCSCAASAAWASALAFWRLLTLLPSTAGLPSLPTDLCLLLFAAPACSSRQVINMLPDQRLLCCGPIRRLLSCEVSRRGQKKRCSACQSLEACMTLCFKVPTCNCLAWLIDQCQPTTLTAH